MWRYLVKGNVRAGQISNVGCGDRQRLMVVNKLEENISIIIQSIRDMVKGVRVMT